MERARVAATRALTEIDDLAAHVIEHAAAPTAVKKV
jgi:hypothetical protein